MAGKTIKAVVLLSGGMDSAVAGALAKAKGREIYALSLFYGQRHEQELKAAQAQAKILKAVRHETLAVPLVAIAQGSLLGKQGGPLSSQGQKGIPRTYVSFRNGVFLALAISFAEAVGAGEIWGGWCRTDHRGYPDCRPVFFRAMEKAAKLGSKAGSQEKSSFKIQAPLAGLSKAQTVKLGLKLKVDFAKTWTCYQGSKKPCQQCDACRLRAEGFREAGIDDPLSRVQSPKSK